MGFSGGVSAQQMTADTFRIVARGNGYTDTTTIRDFAMLKAAEATRQNGGTHFILIGGEDASRVSKIVMPGSARTTFSAATMNSKAATMQSTAPISIGDDARVRIPT